MRSALLLAGGLALLGGCAEPPVPEAPAAPATAEVAPEQPEASPTADAAEETPTEDEVTAPDPRAYAAATSFTAADVKKVVRAHFDRVGACYQKGLLRDGKMKGTIEVRLTIGGRGNVLGAVAKKDKRGAKPKRGSADLTDHEVVSCVEGVFKSLTFAPTGQGLVNLVYPIELRTE